MRKDELIHCRGSLFWNQPKPLTATYVEWAGIVGIYYSGKKTTLNIWKNPLETTVRSHRYCSFKMIWADYSGLAVTHTGRPKHQNWQHEYWNQAQWKYKYCQLKPSNKFVGKISLLCMGFFTPLLKYIKKVSSYPVWSYFKNEGFFLGIS